MPGPSLRTMTLVMLFVSVIGVAVCVADPQSAAAAATAVRENTDLVTQFSKEIGSTPEQAAGAAGALFGVAKSRLSPSDFAKVAKAVPNMTSLLNAAPAVVGTSGLSQLAGSAGSLAAAASAFSKLGLKPEMVSKAASVLTSLVSKSGGANVGNLLAGAFK